MPGLEYLVVFVGGGLGAVARFVLGTAVQKASAAGFPWGTFVVNMLGCLLVGVIAELIRVRVDWQGHVRLFLVVGILGGFTTFSSFGYETVALIQSGKLMDGLLNAFGQLILGLIFVALGLYATHHFTN